MINTIDSITNGSLQSNVYKYNLVMAYLNDIDISCLSENEISKANKIFMIGRQLVAQMTSFALSIALRKRIFHGAQ